MTGIMVTQKSALENLRGTGRQLYDLYSELDTSISSCLALANTLHLTESQVQEELNGRESLKQHEWLVKASVVTCDAFVYGHFIMLGTGLSG